MGIVSWGDWPCYIRHDMGAVDPVNGVLDDLIVKIQANFHAFLLARGTLQLGGNVVDQFSDDTILEANIGPNIAIEPLPLVELKGYKAAFPDFLLEVFHGKAVQYWHDCLLRIFCHYLDLHFTGARPFVELKGRDVRIDFTSPQPTAEQIRVSLTKDFEFVKYSDRQKLINKLRNQSSAAVADLAHVHKHILVRNAIQHKTGILDAYCFKELGVAAIEMLDERGVSQMLKEGDRAQLSVPEFDAFRRSLLLVGQAWRT